MTIESAAIEAALEIIAPGDLKRKDILRVHVGINLLEMAAVEAFKQLFINKTLTDLIISIQFEEDCKLVSDALKRIE